MLAVMLRRLSAYPKDLRYMPPMLAPVPEVSTSAKRESMTSRNKRGDKMAPCLMLQIS